MRYRISFVVTIHGDVLPLQQCVDATFEESHFVEKGYWLLDPPEIVKLSEITPVSEQLEYMIAEVAQYQEKPKKGVVARGPAPVQGPLRKLVQTHEL